MRRRTLVVNGALVLALAGAVGGAVVAVGDPSSAATSEARTAEVSRGDVTASVTASGNLSASTAVGVNFAGSGGTVTAVRVKVGEHVTRGQALAAVDATSARQSLASAQASLAAARAQLSSTTQGQTSAERSRDQASIRAAQVSVDNAETSLAQARASRTLDTRQQKAAVASAQAAYDSATTTSARASASAALSQAKNVRDTTLLKDAQQIENAAGQVNSAKAQLASAEVSASVNAQAATPGSVAGAEAQIAAAEVQVDQAKTTLEQTVLRAPVDGTVSSVSGTVGESSSSTSSSSSSSTTTSTSTGSSATGFVVLSNLDQLQVVSMVAEADATKLKVGQEASVTFSAAGVTASGSVTAIDVQETITNNVVEYGVTVQLGETPTGLKLGQTASVAITTGRAAGVLTVPSAAVTTVGGTSTVTVRKNGTDTTTVIQSGLVGDARTEITGGLADGDTVVLPTSSPGATSGFTFPRGGGGPAGGLGR